MLVADRDDCDFDLRHRPADADAGPGVGLEPRLAEDCKVVVRMTALSTVVPADAGTYTP